MKRFLLIIAACFPVIGLLAANVEPMPADTVIRLENKRIVVKDNGRTGQASAWASPTSPVATGSTT